MDMVHYGDSSRTASKRRFEFVCRRFDVKRPQTKADKLEKVGGRSLPPFPMGLAIEGAVSTPNIGNVRPGSSLEQPKVYITQHIKQEEIRRPPLERRLLSGYEACTAARPTFRVTDIPGSRVYPRAGSGIRLKASP